MVGEIRIPLKFAIIIVALPKGFLCPLAMDITVFFIWSSLADIMFVKTLTFQLEHGYNMESGAGRENNKDVVITATNDNNII